VNSVVKFKKCAHNPFKDPKKNSVGRKYKVWKLEAERKTRNSMCKSSKKRKDE
jgi:hypothetical protein